jgi:hypothetical protein
MQLFVCLSLLAAPPAFVAVGVDGVETRGTLVEFTTDRVVLTVSGKEVTLPTAQIVRLAPEEKSPPSEPIGAHVRLTDGSRLAAGSYGVAGRSATIRMGDTSIACSTDVVHSVRFKQQTHEIAAQWEQILKSPAAADLIVIRDGPSIDFLEGVLGDVTPDRVEFTLDGEKVPVKPIRVEGVVYYHARAGRSAAEGSAGDGAACIVNDANGSSIGAQSLALEGERLRIQTPAGVSVTLPLSLLTTVEFPAQYLSQFKPESVAFTQHVRSSAALLPLVDRRFRPRVDRALDGGPLRVGGRSYNRGLALHSRTEISYLLPESFARFTALAGIDDRVRPGGNVRLVISADERVLFDRILTGGDEPVPVAVEISGAARLRILVDFGDDATDIGDHLDLVEARLFK